jgi:hypothetical protein
MCHSSCKSGFCANTAINDPTQCTACHSDTSVTYLPLTTNPGTCSPNSTTSTQKNIQLLQYISTSTIIGNSYLTSVTIDGSTSSVNSDIKTLFNTKIALDGIGI